MKRDEYKAALTREVAGDAIAEAFAKWRERRGITRTGEMTIDQWRDAYEVFFPTGHVVFPLGDAAALTPAPIAAPVTAAPAPIAAAAAPAPEDLDRALDGLGMVLSDKALAPLRDGLAALRNERDNARAEAVRAKMEAAELVSEAAATPAIAGTHRTRKVSEETLGDLLGARTAAAQGVMVTVCDCPTAPTIDPLFLPPACTPEIFRAMNCGLNIALWGNAGTGKSSTVRWIAALTRRPYFEISFHEETSGTELFGSPGIEGDQMVWVPGDLLVAMQTPFAIIDLSEISASRPGLVMQLNAPLEEGSRAIFVGGKRHAVHPTVTFFATSNDNGSGEAAAQFAGVRPMNKATRSRFIWVELQTPDRAQLARMIHRAANLPRPAADILAKFEKDMEAQVKAGRCEATPGLRAWKGFARLVMAGTGAMSAFAMAVEHTGSTEDAAVWRQELPNHDWTRFETLARGADDGSAPDAAPDGAPIRTRAGFEEL